MSSTPIRGRLSRRLAGHFAMCAGAATALSSSQANAEVVYAPVNWPVPANIDGLYINVQTLATGSAGSVVAGWDINPYSATSLTWFNATGTGMLRFPGVTTGSAGSLNIGTSVGASGSYGSGAVTVGSAAGNWRLNASNYFGFRFVGSSGQTHYGWGKFVIGSAINGADRTITEIAWEAVPGLSIAVGDTGGGGGTYDPCSPNNQTVAAGNNLVGFNANAADLSLSSCSPGLTAFKANYYKFVPAISGNFDISTCTGTGDTILAVADLCSTNANILACNDNFCGTGSQVTVNLSEGVPYYVVLGSASSTPFANPVPIAVTPWYNPCTTSNPTLAVGSNSVAVNQTTAENLLVGGMNIRKANFYKFTPNVDGNWSFSTCATGAATRMAILSDCNPGATVIASDDNGCGGSSARVSADLFGGVPVYVVVGGESADIPSPIGVEVAGPPVEACANAVAASYGLNDISSTQNPGLNQIVRTNAAQNTTTVVYNCQWFKFTPTATGAFTIKACSAGDTKIAIGTSCPTVSSQMGTIAYNDDAPTCPTGGGATTNFGSWIDSTCNGATGTCFPLTQDLVAGQTYYIVVGGYAAGTVVSGSMEIDGPQGNPCPADFDSDGVVGGTDLTALLAAWGSSGGDLDGDGTTAGTDLTVLLAGWGPCNP